jgi:hypothetical protein
MREETFSLALGTHGSQSRQCLRLGDETRNIWPLLALVRGNEAGCDDHLARVGPCFAHDVAVCEELHFVDANDVGSVDERLVNVGETLHSEGVHTVAVVTGDAHLVEARIAGVLDQQAFAVREGKALVLAEQLGRLAREHVAEDEMNATVERHGGAIHTNLSKQKMYYVMMSFGGIRASAADGRNAGSKDDTALIQLVAGSLRRSSKLLGVRFPQTAVVLVINCIDNVDFVRELYDFLTNAQRYKCSVYVWQTVDVANRNAFLTSVDFPAVVYWNVDMLVQNVSKLANIMAVTSSDWRPHFNSQIVQKVINCMDILNNFYLNTTSKRYNLPLIYKEFSDGHEIAVQETVVDWVRRITKKAGDKGLVFTSSSMEKDDFFAIVNGEQPPPARLPARAVSIPARNVAIVTEPSRPREPPTGGGLWANATDADVNNAGSLIDEYVFDGDTLTTLLQNLGYQFSNAAGTRAYCLFFAVNNALANYQENNYDKAEQLARRVIQLQTENPQLYARNVKRGTYKNFDLSKGYGQDEELLAVSELLKVQIKCFSTQPYENIYQKIPQTFVPLSGNFTKTIVLRNHLPVHYDSYVKGTWSDQAWEVQTRQL